MRDHSHHIELSREEAVEDMLEALPEWFSTPRFEQVPLDQSAGRVLAEDVAAKIDVPNSLTCCLDSVAVHWDDFAGLPEGQVPDTSGWVRGVDWEFANTGIAMPEGFDTAVVVEHVTVSDDAQSVAINSAPSERFAGTRAAGSQMRAGDVVVKAGCVITPDVAARIASAGHSTATVVARPRVAFVPTGDELVPPNVPFSESRPERFAARGRVYESNSAVVRGKVEQWGGVYVPFDIVPDDRDAIRRALEKACEVADIVVLNAGSSKGSDDWCVEVIEEMGTVVCHQTNHGPGHHSSYALIDGVPIVGISGPSGGASFTLNFYLLPVMKQFFGLDPEPRRIPARLGAAVGAGLMHKLAKENPGKLPGEQRPPEATDPGSSFYAVKFMTLEAAEDGTLVATPVQGKAGSAQAQHANAYYMMPAGAGDVPPQAGDVIFVELRNQGL